MSDHDACDCWLLEGPCPEERRLAEFRAAMLAATLLSVGPEAWP